MKCFSEETIRKALILAFYAGVQTEYDSCHSCDGDAGEEDWKKAQILLDLEPTSVDDIPDNFEE